MRGSCSCSCNTTKKSSDEKTLLQAYCPKRLDDRYKISPALSQMILVIMGQRFISLWPSELEAPGSSLPAGPHTLQGITLSHGTLLKSSSKVRIVSIL